MQNADAAAFDQLLSTLTSRQHLAPHASVRQSLDRLTKELHICPQAVEQTLAWLQLESQQSIGRLRRTELMQLARTIYRICGQRVTQVR